MDRAELMRRMRDHVRYDPERIMSGEQAANREERRAAARVLASHPRTDDAHETEGE